MSETIRNRDALATDERRGVALDAVAAGVEAADPAAAVRATVSLDGGRLHVADERIDLDAVDRVLVIGGGKPAARMARALDDLLPATPPVDGVVVTTAPVDAGRVAVVEGAHPLPDEAGLAGARRVLDAARGADERTLVLAVIGGGGSALLPAPAGDCSLDDLQATTASLLDAGADIGAINAVRKHCSAIKGGRLAAAAAPARVRSLIASDVVGDDLATIASGPTAPDPTTYDDALAAAEWADVALPERVREHLRAGAAGERPETPTADDAAFDHVSNRIVLNGRRAVTAAADRAAEAAGYEPLVLTTRLRGPAGAVGETIAAIVEESASAEDPIAPPAAIAAGGETTVDVRGDGAGGPNAELALRVALDCSAGEWTLAAVDTDGSDGGSAVAGAIVDDGTVADRDDGRGAREALSESDSHGFLRDRRALIETGATGTNVNDLLVVLID